MSNKPCERIGRRLVDYADGELGAADVVGVESHLAACEECREELRLLRTSLELARAVWNAPSAEIRPVQPLRRRVGLRLAAGLATCAVALAIVFGLGLLSPDDTQQHAERDRPTADDRGPIAAPRPGDGVPNPREDVDVERLIAEEERAARLAVSVRLLATQPGLAQYHQRAERYLTETYGGTAAAHSVMRQNVPLPIKEPKS